MRRSYCSWDVDHASWVVTLHSPEEQEAPTAAPSRKRSPGVWCGCWRRRPASDRSGSEDADHAAIPTRGSRTREHLPSASVRGRSVGDDSSGRAILPPYATISHAGIRARP